jgi:hypothetical protein
MADLQQQLPMHNKTFALGALPDRSQYSERCCCMYPVRSQATIMRGLEASEGLTRLQVQLASNKATLAGEPTTQLHGCELHLHCHVTQQAPRAIEI